MKRFIKINYIEHFEPCITEGMLESGEPLSMGHNEVFTVLLDTSMIAMLDEGNHLLLKTVESGRQEYLTLTDECQRRVREYLEKECDDLT